MDQSQTFQQYYVTEECDLPDITSEPNKNWLATFYFGPVAMATLASDVQSPQWMPPRRPPNPDAGS